MFENPSVGHKETASTKRLINAIIHIFPPRSYTLPPCLFLHIIVIMRFSTGATTSLLGTFFFASRSSGWATAANVIVVSPNEDDGDGVDAGIFSLVQSLRSPSSPTTGTTATARARGVEGVRALGSSGSGRLLQTSTACTAGYVDCDDGLVRGSGQTCYDACGPNCCGPSYEACRNFTGKVCKDGSCVGELACKSATIPLVLDSCKGYHACYNAGFVNSTVGNMTSSCKGRRSCSRLGNNGVVGNIDNSCLDERSCLSLGESGKVGNVQNSCNSTFSCGYAGSQGGIVGNIQDSCFGVKSCYKVGFNAPRSPDYPATVGNIVNSCRAFESCREVGDGEGGGGSGAEVGNITSSCNAIRGCRNTGDAFHPLYNINLLDCCNTNYRQCDEQNKDTLQCTAAPTNWCFPTKNQLKVAVMEYISESCFTNSTCFAGQKVGMPIGNWCTKLNTDMSLLFDQ